VPVQSAYLDVRRRLPGCGGERGVFPGIPSRLKGKCPSSDILRRMPGQRANKGGWNMDNRR